MLEALQASGLGVAIGFTVLLGWGLRRALRMRPSDTDSHHFVSVLVAARNEERRLPRCLESLAAQEYPAKYCEFIIIDDGSVDRTGDIARGWAVRDRRFRLISLEDQPLCGMGPKKRALSAGLSASSGEIVMITDADCRMEPGWINAMAGCFGQGISAVCGPVRFRSANPFFSRLARFEAQASAMVNAAVIGLGGALSCAGANFAYRRESFNLAGGFDPGGRSFSGDDDLLLQRFRAGGLKIRYCFDPRAQVETEPPLNAQAYWLRKRRHLSAGRRYAAHWIILAAAIYGGCLATTLLGALALLGHHADLGFLAWWGLFSFSLALVFHWGAKSMGDESWLTWSIPAAILFPLYFTLIHPLTLWASPSWKGRGGITSK